MTSKIDKSAYPTCMRNVSQKRYFSYFFFLITKKYYIRHTSVKDYFVSKKKKLINQYGNLI